MADLTVTASSVKSDSAADVGSGIAGVAITAGQVLRYNSTTGKYVLADADTATEAVSVGIALNSAAADQPVSFQRAGVIAIGATVAVGTVYVVSATAGGIAPVSDLVSGDYVTLLGVASAAGKLSMNIFVSGVTVA